MRSESYAWHAPGASAIDRWRRVMPSNQNGHDVVRRFVSVPFERSDDAWIRLPPRGRATRADSRQLSSVLPRIAKLIGLVVCGCRQRSPFQHPNDVELNRLSRPEIPQQRLPSQIRFFVDSRQRKLAPHQLFCNGAESVRSRSLVRTIRCCLTAAIRFPYSPLNSRLTNFITTLSSGTCNHGVSFSASGLVGCLAQST